MLDLVPYPKSIFSTHRNRDGVKYNSFNNSFAFHNNDDQWMLTVEVPGFDKEDINITVQNNKLFIKGQTEDKKISKYVTIPENVSVDTAEASLDKGILTVQFEYQPEHEIPIT